MSRRILSIILSILLIAPMLASLTAFIPVATAQGIINYVKGSPGDEYGVYPGGVVIVNFNAPIVAQVIITIYNAHNTSVVYATQYYTPPAPGTYTVQIPIPKKLPNIGTTDPPALLVTVSIPFIGSDSRTLYVYPLIEVSPSTTTIVDGLGNFKSVTVYGYGFPEGINITDVEFNTTPYLLDTPATTGSDGSVAVTVSFNATFQLPMGTYSVNFSYATTTTPSLAANTSTGILSIIPQAVITPNYGHGRDVEAISIAGYGFPANATVSQVKLFNTNFTNVVYVFNVNTSADANGFFNITNLKSFNFTNMTAGLYIPIVVLSDGSSYTFRNTYHLVRPLLCYVVGGAPQCDAPAPSVKPGDTITIAAYGYGPGEEWGYQANFLNVSLDKIRWLAVGIPLGKDGNATFTVQIPLDTPFGAHYIWGIDRWEYEYSLAVVVGVKAYWVGINPLTNTSLPSTQVSATLPGLTTSFIVCPCETVNGTAFCGECVKYGEECDYLGDLIKVVAYGMVPGESVEVYFGDKLVGTATADSQGVLTFSFVVPTLPEGEYTIRIISSVSGEIVVNFSMNVNDYANPQVTPKILLAALSGDYVPILVGSGIVRVLGTGFTPDVAVLGVLVNDTDALLSVTSNVQRWTTDSNGVLTSQFTDVLGLWIPMVQPGKYAVSLVYSLVGGVIKKSLPGYVYVVNNISRLATVDDVSIVSSKVDKVSSTLGSVANTVSSISTTVNSIASSVSNISSRLNDVLSQLANVATKNDVNTLAGKIDSVSSTLSSVSGKIDTLSASLSDAVGKINSVASQLSTAVESINSVSSKVNSIASDVSGLKTSVSDLSSKVNSISSQLANVATKSDLANLATKSDVNAVSSKVDSVQSSINTVSGKVDTAISKADAAGATASNAFYTGVGAVVFSLLAMIFALLAYLTVRRSIVSK
ncbi:MAG: methyl-accepting chemotaxis protein [Desulfurococcus sp.]|nr:methyl-accepting chemotaxis protein [Desulfurococcus sp.]